jgi:ketosteroid isomerase-like protein
MKFSATAQLADEYFAAVESADLDALQRIYAADAIIWHNYDNMETSKQANIAVVAAFPKLFKSFSCTDVRRAYFDGGFVQQHVVRGVKASGEPFAVPACMVVAVRGDEIVRVDEYFDSAQDARPPDAR